MINYNKHIFSDIFNNLLLNKILYISSDNINNIILNKNPFFKKYKIISNIDIIENDKSNIIVFILYNKNTIYVFFRIKNSVFDNNGIELFYKNKVKFMNNIYINKMFYNQFNSIKDLLFKKINNICDNDNTIIKYISFIGFSLGGAISTIASSIYGFTNKDKLQITNYTYGSPKVGNLQFKKFFNKYVNVNYRIVIDDDDKLINYPSNYYIHVSHAISLDYSKYDINIINTKNNKYINFITNNLNLFNSCFNNKLNLNKYKSYDIYKLSNYIDIINNIITKKYDITTLSDNFNDIFNISENDTFDSSTDDTDSHRKSSIISKYPLNGNNSINKYLRDIISSNYDSNIIIHNDNVILKSKIDYDENYLKNNSNMPKKNIINNMITNTIYENDSKNNSSKNTSKGNISIDNIFDDISTVTDIPIGNNSPMVSVKSEELNTSNITIDVIQLDNMQSICI